jgi:hypothetical protein
MVSAGRRDQAVADGRVALQEVAALVVEFRLRNHPWPHGVSARGNREVNRAAAPVEKR